MGDFRAAHIEGFRQGHRKTRLLLYVLLNIGFVAVKDIAIFFAGIFIHCVLLIWSLIKLCIFIIYLPINIVSHFLYKQPEQAKPTQE
jgi:hypothetical protein